MDSDTDLQDFLRGVRELGQQRDDEDEARNRQLEQEILQERRERQVRQAGMLLEFSLVLLHAPHPVSHISSSLIDCTRS